MRFNETIRRFTNMEIKTLGLESLAEMMYRVQGNNQMRIARFRGEFETLKDIVYRDLPDPEYRNLRKNIRAASKEINDDTALRMYLLLTTMTLRPDHYFTYQALNSLLDMTSADIFLKTLEKYGVVNSREIRVSRTVIVPTEPQESRWDVSKDTVRISGDEIDKAKKTIRKFSSKEVKGFKLSYNPRRFQYYEDARNIIKGMTKVYLGDIRLFLFERFLQLEQLGLLSQDPTIEIETKRKPEFCYHVTASTKRFQESPLAISYGPKGILVEESMLLPEEHSSPRTHPIKRLPHRSLIGLYSDVKEEVSFFKIHPRILGKPEFAYVERYNLKLPDISTSRNRRNLILMQAPLYSYRDLRGKPAILAREKIEDSAQILARPIGKPFMENGNPLILEKFLI